MRIPSVAMGGAAHAASWNQGLWLHSKGWDLAYLTGSGVLVVIPLILYELIGTSAMFVNLFVAGVIGGPHMYATFFRTALDESFRQRHPWLIGSSLLIPVLVVACALWHFQLLITLFFFWASVHVLHQIAYILECYDRRQSERLQKWSRFIDYAVVFSSLYPLASYRFHSRRVHHWQHAAPLSPGAQDAAGLLRRVGVFRSGAGGVPGEDGDGNSPGAGALPENPAHGGDHRLVHPDYELQRRPPGDCLSGFQHVALVSVPCPDVVHHHPAAAARRDRTRTVADHCRQGTFRDLLRGEPRLDAGRPGADRSGSSPCLACRSSRAITLLSCRSCWFIITTTIFFSRVSENWRGPETPGVLARHPTRWR